MIQLAPQEHIIAVFRKHWLVIFFEVVGLAVIGILPLVLHMFGRTLVYGSLGTDIEIVFGFLYVLFLILLWIAGFNIWMDYYLDRLVLTNTRVIEIEQRGLFSREISSLNLENVQDVTIEIHGILQTFFKLGDVHVQTSGAQRQVSIGYLAHPEQAKHIIMDLHNQVLNRIRSVRIEQQ